MDVKVLKTRYQPSFLWFTRQGRAYLVTDAASLARVGEVHGEVHAPLQLRELADELLRSGAARPVLDVPGH